MLVDVHTHLDLIEKEGKDIDVIIKNAKGFAAIISNGTRPESNRKVLEYAKKYKNVKPALGIYPGHVEELSDKEIEKEIEFIKKSKPFAIGEVGLDLKHYKNLTKQKKYLKKFIQLAKELEIPMLIHSWAAEKETIEFLEKNKAEKVVMHCFCGNKELTDKGLALGYYYTIPTAITKSKTFRKLAKRVPLNRLLTETDAPYLSPREWPNEPAFIKDSIKKIAEIKKITQEELEKIIYMNYQTLFLK
jgi:TatD DNase family protein